MNTKAKTVADTRWESMSKVSNWFKLHWVWLLQYLEEKNINCKPPMKWWFESFVLLTFQLMLQPPFTHLKDWLHYFLLSAKAWFVFNLITCIYFKQLDQWKKMLMLIKMSVLCQMIGSLLLPCQYCKCHWRYWDICSGNTWWSWCCWKGLIVSKCLKLCCKSDCRSF